VTEDLLKIADDLAGQDGPGRPREAYLRRSLSTSYYALFHALARLCADELVGVTSRNSEPWIRVYRALEHVAAKTALNRSDVQKLDSAVKMFATAFTQLQEKRQTADYDPRPFPFGRKVTRGYIQQARTAIAALAGLNTEQRRIIATTVLFKSRP
jgi:hypothetical protein